MYTIVPFEKHHQPGIDKLLAEIQDEFELPFRNPNSVTVAEYVASGNDFWVALSKNQVIGTIGLSHFDTVTGVIRNLFVSKAFRGKQTEVAKSLLYCLLDRAQQLGYESVYLGTMEQFKAAQKFYSKNNFVPIPQTELPENMSFNPVDSLFYIRNIKG